MASSDILIILFQASPYKVVLLVNPVIEEIVPSLIRLGRVSFYDFKTPIFDNKPL